MKGKSETLLPDLWQERTSLLLGEDALSVLGASSVVVAGLGGVGAYAAEMMARAGIGRIVIVDSDRVSASNKNRQLLATDSNIGKMKTEVMASRLKDINPGLEIVSVSEYLTEDNIGALLSPAGRADFLIDAIDTLSPKIALMAYCYRSGIPIVSSMGSGAKLDATKVRLADLSKSYNCPLAYIIRKKLRKMGITKGIQVVFSEELPDRRSIVPVEGERNKKSQVGTVPYLPPVFGCVCAQAAISGILERKPDGSGAGKGLPGDLRDTTNDKMMDSQIELRMADTTACAWFADAAALYLEAFPEVERRPLEALERLVDMPGGNFVFSGVFVEGEFGGFITYWDFDSFIYAEHFAVLPSMRGRNIGGAVLEQLKSSVGKPVILEVEPPQTEMAARRIGFYRRHGFEVVEKDYLQPSYRPGGDPLPLWLLACGHIDDIGSAVRRIYADVYRVVPNPEDLRIAVDEIS